MATTENGSGSAADEINQLQAMVSQVIAGLRNQQDWLRLREMTLPASMMECVGALSDILDKMHLSLHDEQTELSQLRSLVATAALMNSSLDPDSVLAQAMDEIINLTGAERGYILLTNPASGELEFRVTRVAETSASDPTPVSTKILKEVLSTGAPLLTDNARDDPRLQGSDTVARFVMRSVLCVPLKYKDDIIGAIYVDNRLRAGVFTQRELALLTAFANQTAVAIENARLFASVRASLAEITEMKELMENVFASIASGVITTDAADLVTTYNRAASTILGREPAEAVGQTLPQLLPPMEVDLDSALQAVREYNHSGILEAEPEMPGRGRIVLSMKLSPLKDAQHQTQGVAMVLDDLTDQRQREEVIDLMRRYLPPGMMDNIHHIASLDLGGVRRDMSCLFADICPIYTFPKDLPPQQVLELLNLYVTAATNTIHQSGGLIDKYMGSEMMVLFNTQLNPNPGHALQAVTAALDLRDALVALYHTQALSPDQHYYRIGVHSGVATVGNVGSQRRRNFTAIGDTINLSKRLQENAAPGQIITSDDTIRVIQDSGISTDDIRFTFLRSIQVKGREQLTELYEVNRA